MSYQNERERFIEAMTREGLRFHVSQALLREATGINRRAELACSSEAADRDRVPCPAMPTINNKGQVRETGKPCLCGMYQGKHEPITRITLQDYRAELRIKAMLPAGWDFSTAGDPRGYTLRVIPPSYAERNVGRDQFNRDTIGVPSGPSGLRF